MRRAVLLALLPLAGATPAHAAAAICPPPAGTVEAAPAEAGEVTIACVGSTPISEATFEHWDEVAAAPRRASELSSSSAHEALLLQVMGFLLSAAWVQGEAKALGVALRPVRVRREFDRIRDEQFPRRRTFRRFLKKSRETVADLLLRVEVDMLSQRIQKRIMAEHRGAKAKQEALSRFVKHFKEKWTAQTYCAPQYAVTECGHVQANL